MATRTGVLDLCKALRFNRTLSGVSKSYGALSPTCLAGASLNSLPGYRTYIAQPTSLTSTSRFSLVQPQKSKQFEVVRGYRHHKADKKTSQYLGTVGIELKEDDDYTPLTDSSIQSDVVDNINSSLTQGDHGRLFAVVYICGSQYKVTAEDILFVRNEFPPDVGDRIRLEKVLAVGGKDFTLFGQPLLNRNQVKIEATIVEKTLTPNRVWFMYLKRRGYFNVFKVFREKQTMLVINSIQMATLPQTAEKGQSEQLEASK